MSEILPARGRPKMFNEEERRNRIRESQRRYRLRNKDVCRDRILRWELLHKAERLVQKRLLCQIKHPLKNVEHENVENMFENQ